MTDDAFSIRATWKTPQDDGRRDVAEIRIGVGGKLFTRISDFERKEERDFVRASSVSLAIWFSDNWWRLRYESLPNGSLPSVNWRLRHELTSASGGTFWPPVMIHSTGNRVLFTQAFGGAVSIGSLRYSLPDMESANATSYEEGLNQFFKEVIDNCATALDGDVLTDLVGSLKTERSDPEMAAWRRLEARLGYDPDTVPDDLMQAMSVLEERVGEDILGEAATAKPGLDAAASLQAVIKAVDASEIALDFSLAETVSGVRSSTAPPWQLGREAAFQVRQAGSLRDGPIGTQSFADLFRTRTDDLKRPGTARHLSYSARMHCGGDRQRVAVQSADQRDRRFELACMLGDRIWSQSDYGIVTKAKTDRQKFQRAFAQNLLVPYADLCNDIDPSSPTEDQVDRAARRFKVHPNVIKRLLVLEGIVPEETLEDRLEAA